MMYWYVDMRRVLLLIFWQFGLLSGPLLADVVTLKDGRQISGSVESGNIQELHIKVGDQSQKIDIHEVQAIQFGVSQPAPPPPKAAALAPKPAREVTTPQGAGAGAATGAAVQIAAGAVALIGAFALVFAGKLTGNGMIHAPQTPSPKRGRQ